MATVQIDRTCGIDEITAEMDRRGAVIERLEQKLDALIKASNAISDRNNSYVGHDIVITCESHGDALRLMRELRDATAKAEARP